MGGPGLFGSGATTGHHAQPPPSFQQQQPYRHQHHALPPAPPPQQSGSIVPTLNTPFAGAPGSRNVYRHSHHPLPPPPIHAHGHPHPPHHHSHGPLPFAADQGQDLAVSPGPGQIPPHSYFGSQPSQHLGGRCSVSPVGVLPNGTGSGKMNGSWMGSGMERLSTGGEKGGEWGGRDLV
ncbi:hypothetical protein Hypma_016583 [Hypsizygus marmoreus]|uniref:Uncharacterized protein n=1 Tax=Hypsizygus marmoreus TaxID=39966 RepID=A0A369J4G3_HYPMA|nr:hypothetical protein Hypma_016583 [Hypsizygus marmoreus]